MNQYEYHDLTIEVVDDPMYSYGSADNSFNYSRQHFGEAAKTYPTSKHGIKLFQNKEMINSCIISGSGGATTIHKNSSLLDNDQLIVCCCDTLFCLTLPDLEAKWKTQTDMATCFKVIKLQDDYLVHGELLISRVDKQGVIKWQFGGNDIFVSLEGAEECVVEDNHIILTDFEKTQYKLNFDGKLL
ncbi:hypothetical protein ACSBL2_15475 [Pedobacter sp. AW31-3R]|uniref:hypothetical protein n=1 Tax=Pedobacter sp. AW31-3R TaxID=3445781 RepID=UPI003FA14D11